MSDIRVKCGSSFYGYDLPDSLEKVIEVLQSKLNTVPKDVRDTAVLEIDYDDGSIEFEVFYYRKATKQEEKEKQRREEAMKENRVRFLKSQLEALGVSV